MESKFTCQVCGREIKAKKGIIAHHGYKRPEQGWQTDSCIGARQLPYEKSRDIIPKAIQTIQLFIKSKEYIIEQVNQNKIEVPSIFNKVTKPTDSLYEVRKKEYLTKLDYGIKYAVREIERLQKRYDDWKVTQ